MKKVNENKLFLAIILAAFIIGFFHFLSVVYISSSSDITAHVTENVMESIQEQKVVTRVIDGDTVVVQGGDHVRLLGMDADERGDPCYKAAKERLLAPAVAVWHFFVTGLPTSRSWHGRPCQPSEV